MKRKNFIAAALLIASSQLASAGIFGITDSIGANQGGVIGGIIGDVGDDDIPKLYVSQYEALRIAKQWYGNRTDVDYYIGGSTLIDNEYESNASELPDSSAWVRTGHHWLIVVDEHPNQNWSHECGYIYVQSEKSRLTPIKSCRVPGRMLPSGVGLTLTDANNPYGTNADLKPSVPLIDNAGFNAEFAGKTYAMIINSASTRNDNLERYCNDCSFIYQMLWKQYNVPTANIKMLMPIDTLMCRANGSGYVAMPTNIAQTVYPLSVSTISSCLNQLKSNMTSDSRLMVFITGNAGITDSGEPFIMLPGGGRMMASDINALFRGVNARVVDYVLGVSNAAAFVDYLSDKGRVITAATGVGEAAASCPDTPFSEFLWNWTSAQYVPSAETCPNGYDPDNNGRVTLEEAFAYADSLSVNSNGTISTENQYLIEDVAFNNIPEAVDLYIRDNPADTGKEPNNTTEIVWNSPDIWVTSVPDPNKEHTNHFIDLNLDNQFCQIYINVRVTNRGQNTYTGSGQYLHVYWTNMVFNLDLYTWLGVNCDQDKDAVGYEIFPLELEDSIMPGESRVYVLATTLPQKFIKQLKRDRNKFGINVLARISNSSQMGDDQGNPMPVIRDALVSVSGSRKVAQKSNLFILGYTQMKCDILVSDDGELYKYEVEPDDIELFNKIELSMELSPSGYQSWIDGGSVANDVTVSNANPRKFYFHSSQSYISNIKAIESLDSIRLSYNIISSEDVLSPQSYNLCVRRKNCADTNIMTGTMITIFSDARSQELSPAVSSSLENGTYTLSETNVSEDAIYQWIGNNSELIAEGKSVNIDASCASDISKLRVETSDGIINYVDINLDDVPIIESISPNPFSTQFDVRLSRQAKANTKIHVNSISSSMINREYVVGTGEKEITIFTSDYPSGSYIVSVQENGKILGSKQVVK